MSYRCSQVLEAAIFKTGKITSRLNSASGKAQQRYWVEHLKGATKPEKFEVSVLAMIRGLADYADAHETRYGDSISNDYYIGGEWRDMMKGWLALLNGEHGRLDGGVLDNAARELAVAAGFDRDLNT